MEKENWISFLSEKLRSQISLENFGKLQTWFLGGVIIFAFGSGFNTTGSVASLKFLFETKILFLLLAHAFLLTVFYLPTFIEKGQKNFSRALGLFNFTSLVINAIAISALIVVVLMLSTQVFSAMLNMEATGFYLFVGGVQLLVSYGYFLAALFFFLSMSFFPQALVKIVEKMGSKLFYAVAGLHLAQIVFMSIVYTGIVAVGSQGFFDQLRLAVTFLIALGGLLFFVGRILKESAIPSLSALEYDVASGRLERHDDILQRYQEAFASNRMNAWIGSYAHIVASGAHAIAALTHEAMGLAGKKKPTETELRTVEECYKKADQLCKKLSKANNRFLVASVFFYVSEIERMKIEAVKDEFSKQLRNAKLELMSVRKSIDEKLVSLKNFESQKLLEEKASSPKEMPATKS